MRVGVPKGIKDHEDRVDLVPSSVAELARHGYEVLIQTGAGLGAGLEDALYVAAGGHIVPDAETIFRDAEMVVEVKEPLAPERRRLRPGQVLFTYLHLAPPPPPPPPLAPKPVPPALPVKIVAARAGRYRKIIDGPVRVFRSPRVAPGQHAVLLTEERGRRGTLIPWGRGVWRGKNRN